MIAVDFKRIARLIELASMKAAQADVKEVNRILNAITNQELQALKQGQPKTMSRASQIVELLNQIEPSKIEEEIQRLEKEIAVLKGIRKVVAPTTTNRGGPRKSYKREVVALLEREGEMSFDDILDKIDATSKQLSSVFSNHHATFTCVGGDRYKLAE